MEKKQRRPKENKLSHTINFKIKESDFRILERMRQKEFSDPSMSNFLRNIVLSKIKKNEQLELL